MKEAQHTGEISARLNRWKSEWQVELSQKSKEEMLPFVGEETKGKERRFS